MSFTVRQSTARTYMVGPVLDADGAAVTDGVVADFKISKNGAAPAGLDGSATLAHRHTGHYSLALTAGDHDTVGTAQITLDDSVNACPAMNLQVVEEAVFDALYAASATGALPVSTGGIVAGSFAAGAIDAAAIAANAIGASELAADAATEIGTAVWVSATRTLTQSAASVVAAVSGSDITIARGDTLSAALTGLGSIANRSKIWFTAKRAKSDADSDAIIQITEAGGLLTLNGTTGTSGNGSITVDDEDDGDITIALDEVASAALKVEDLVYDVQVLRSTGAVNTLTEGRATVSADVTRATS